MVIRVLDHKYFVLRTVDTDDGLKQYVCRDLVDEESNIYRIVRIPHADVTTQLLRYLADIEVEGSFKEMREYASEGDFLCIVMDCGSQEAVPMSERLEREPLSLKERFGYVYKLIERMILSDMPAYFAVAGITPSGVKFTSAMDCSFDFDIHDITEYADYGTDDICGSLADFITGVFAEELRWSSMPELADFIKDLRRQRYSDYMDIFADFKAIEQIYSERDDAETESNSFPFRMWDVTKDLASQLKNISSLLLLLLAVVYLVISIRNTLKPTVAENIYDSVGDMQIIGTQGGDLNE